MDLFSTLWHSDKAKGVNYHPAPMEKYELIPPPANPLEILPLRKLNILGYQSSEKATILEFCKARMVTPRSRGYIGQPTPNDKSMLITQYSDPVGSH